MLVALLMSTRRIYFDLIFLYPEKAAVEIFAVSSLKKSSNSVGKFAKKAVGISIFDNIALYFKCQINKNALPSDCFFLENLPTGN